MTTQTTPYGFIFGPAEVMRIFHDKYHGYVMHVKTDKEALEIRVTPKGLIRVSPVKKILKPKGA